MKRMAAVVFPYAGLATLMVGWCAFAWQAGCPGAAPEWDAAPPGDTERSSDWIVRGAYHRPFWDAAPPGERECLHTSEAPLQRPAVTSERGAVAGERSPVAVRGGAVVSQ